MRRRGLFRQSGAALTEFVVAATVMVPLFIAIPLLGKYADMNHAAVSAARYVAWERAINGNNKTDQDIAEDVRVRILGNTKNGVATGNVSNDGNLSAYNPLWVDHGGNRLLATYQDANVASSDSNFTQSKLLVDFVRNKMGLSDDGLREGMVGIAVANIPNFQPLDSINLNIFRNHVVAGDGWAAASPSDAANRSRQALSANLNAVSKSYFRMIKTFGDGMKYLHPLGQEFNGLAIEYVDPDAIPADRVGP